MRRRPGTSRRHRGARYPFGRNDVDVRSVDLRERLIGIGCRRDDRSAEVVEKRLRDHGRDGGGVHHRDVQLVIAFGENDLDVELGVHGLGVLRDQPGDHGIRLGTRATRRRSAEHDLAGGLGHDVLVDQQYRDQRVPGLPAVGTDHTGDVLIGDLTVRLGGQGGIASPHDGLADREPRMQPCPQGHGVDEHADHRLPLRRVPAVHRYADQQVPLTGPPAQHRRERGVRHLEHTRRHRFRGLVQ